MFCDKKKLVYIVITKENPKQILPFLPYPYYLNIHIDKCLSLLFKKLKHVKSEEKKYVYLVKKRKSF